MSDKTVASEGVDAVSPARPHALYVAWGFPPARTGGTYRALATANGLVAVGFDVTVLTCERELFERTTGTDAFLEAEIDPAIDVVRIPFEWPARDPDIRNWPEERARNPKAWLQWRRQEDRRDFPEVGYGPWKRPLVEAARTIHRRRPVALTVATANPNVDIMPALALHEEFGVPFVYDHRDAWTLDVYAEGETHTDDPRVAQLEREFVTRGTEVWFVNEPISAWYRERYPDSAGKIFTVPNGFDRAFAPLPREGDPGDDGDGERPLTFGYIGTMTPYMPMAELAEGWALARGRDPRMARAAAEFWGYLGFYGAPHAGLLDIFGKQEGSGIDYRGPVPKTEVRSIYARFDVLLLVIASGRFVTSGKVYEYMASGLPIVSIHEPATGASRVLQGYPLWFPARSLDPRDIADALHEAAKAACRVTRGQRADCLAFAEAYERNRLLEPRLRALHSAVTDVAVADEAEGEAR